MFQSKHTRTEILGPHLKKKTFNILKICYYNNKEAKRGHSSQIKNYKTTNHWALKEKGLQNHLHVMSPKTQP